jgi:cyclic beta-1,2-glucan synthetase
LGWSLFVLLTIAFPIYLHVATGLLIHPRGVPWTSHFWSIWGDFRTNSAQIGLALALLPHQAYLMCDAIVRTLYRQFISRKKLLEWVSAAETERSSRNDFVSFLWFMLPAELITLIAVALTIRFRPTALAVLSFPTFIWLLSPLIAYLVSKPIVSKRKLLSGRDVEFARSIARLTWRFFETFVTAQDNWLPPDNFQEDPTPVVAHRTSPTNIGLLLLATSTARDLGYVSSLELVERQELTFGTIVKLGKLHGHLFNWYETTTLEPLLPEYISTVDSGNFAGHLVAVKQANIELPDLRLFDDRVVAGLSDTINAIGIEAERLDSIRQRTEVVTVRQLQNEIEDCQKLLVNNSRESLTSWLIVIDSMCRRASEIDDIVNALSHEHGEESFKELRWWVGALLHQAECWRRDIDTLCGWTRLIPLLETTSDETQPTNGWEKSSAYLAPFPRLRKSHDSVIASLFNSPDKVTLRVPQLKYLPGLPGRWSLRRKTPAICCHGLVVWPEPATKPSKIWTSNFFLTRNASSFQSGTTSPPLVLTTLTMICWLPKRDLQALSRSQRAMCHKSTGSAWGARLRRSMVDARSFRGQAQCSNT